MGACGDEVGCRAERLGRLSACTVHRVHKACHSLGHYIVTVAVQIYPLLDTHVFVSTQANMIISMKSVSCENLLSII